MSKSVLCLSFAFLTFALIVSLLLKADPQGIRELDRFAAGSELEATFAFDSSSGLLMYAHDSGKGAIFATNVRTGVPPELLPTKGVWPKEPSISPGGRYVAYYDFEADINGNGRTLYVLDRESGINHLIKVHNPPTHLGREALFSPDGRSMIYEVIQVDREEAGKDELRIVDLATFEDRHLHWDSGKGARAPAFSPDGTQIYFFTQESCVVRLELATGKENTVGCLPQGTAPYLMFSSEYPVVSQDNSRLLFSIMDNSCPRVALLTVSTGMIEFIDRQECGFRAQFSGEKQDQIVYIALPLDGNRLIKTRRLDGGPSRLIGFPEGISYRIAVDGDSVYALSATPDTTRRVWHFGLKSDSREVVASGDSLEIEKQLLRSMNQITVTSFDGLEVPVRIFYPACRRSGPGPAVLYIHGSPGGREDVSPRLSREIGYLLGKGLTVIAPNYRGSTGYGERIAADNKRDSQVKDLIAVTKAAMLRADIDSSQLYVMAICYSAEFLLEGLMEAVRSAYRGIIVWSGGVMAVAPLGPDRSNVVWIVTAKDSTTQVIDSLPASDREKLLKDMQVQVINDSHLVTDGESRMQALQAIGSFVEKRSGKICQQ